LLITFFPIHHTRAGRFPPICRPALFSPGFLTSLFGKKNKYVSNRYLFMIRSLIESLVGICFFSTLCAFGQQAPAASDERAQRLSDLMARVSVHEAQVTQLLSKGPVPRTNFDLPPPVKSDVPPAPAPPAPHPANPAPGFPNEVDGGAVKEVPAPPSLDDLVADPNAIGKGDGSDSSSDGNASAGTEGDLDEAYARLYDSEIPSRHTGYYFGPLVGLIFPSNVATRAPSNSGIIKNSYESESGYLIGLQAGKDFGDIRFEGEYTYNSFDASAGLKASVHNFFSRLILEKELGDRFDLRTGLGMGLGFVNLEKVEEFSGVGFAYDFLLGVGYRIDENWGLQVDYRYFLTAANDEYDRVKSHAWLVSASMDL
jgi:hypothetical protein